MGASARSRLRPQLPGVRRRRHRGNSSMALQARPARRKGRRQPHQGPVSVLPPRKQGPLLSSLPSPRSTGPRGSVPNRQCWARRPSMSPSRARGRYAQRIAARATSKSSETFWLRHPARTEPRCFAQLPACTSAVLKARPFAHNYMLRGFDADHGQDIEFRVGGLPINMPSHIHGQGYSDLGFLIAGTVRELRSPKASTTRARETLRWLVPSTSGSAWRSANAVCDYSPATARGTPRDSSFCGRLARHEKKPSAPSSI